mmetsp:Transcript_50706/g.108050  ORF Transcript_50706/g.108050 Transcript_50706/m.108050 type:complete len:398 (-) Transcript_50706:139-1332(-)
MSLSPPSDGPLGRSGGGSESVQLQQQQRRSAQRTSAAARRRAGRHSSSLVDVRRNSRFNRAGGAVHSSLVVASRVEDSNRSSLTSRSSDRRVSRGRNSIGFRRESDSCEYEESSQSQSEGGMEVMDLRPRGRLRNYDSSSLASIGSQSSIDSKDKDNLNRSSLKLTTKFIIDNRIVDERGGLFPVASDGSNGGSSVKGGAPKHWDKAKLYPQGKDEDSEEKQRGGGMDTSETSRINSAHSSGAFSLFGESEKSFRAVISRMSSGGEKESRRRSLVSVRLESGLSSCLASRALGDAGDMSSASDSDDRGSIWTEESPLMDDGMKERQMSKLHLQRCIRLIAGFLVLAALSGSVIIYFVPKEQRKLMLESLLDYNLLGRLLESRTTTTIAKESKVAVMA